MYWINEFQMTSKQSLANIATGIPVRVAPSPTLGVEALYERRSRLVLGRWITLIVASDRASTVGALPTRTPGADPARDDPFFPCLVARVVEDAAPQPVGPLLVSPSAVLAPLGPEPAQVLEHDHRRAVLLGELDDTPAHPVPYSRPDGGSWPTGPHCPARPWR